MLALFSSSYFYFTCHRQAHLIHLNYMIIFQDGDTFPASKMGEIAGGGGSCI